MVVALPAFKDGVNLLNRPQEMGSRPWTVQHFASQPHQPTTEPMIYSPS